MSVNFSTGDLFDPAFGFDAIGHGVNCKGLMGAGIAVEFKKRYPAMYNQYNGLCRQNLLLPGQVMPWREITEYSDLMDIKKKHYVYNIASQNNPGRDGNLEAIEVAMHWVDFHARNHGIKHIGLPRIGCGIAGLDWDDVCETIAFVVKDSSVKYTLVSLEDA